MSARRFVTVTIQQAGKKPEQFRVYLDERSVRAQIKKRGLPVQSKKKKRRAAKSTKGAAKR